MWTTDYTAPGVEPWWVEKPLIPIDNANLGEIILSEYIDKAQEKV